MLGVLWPTQVASQIIRVASNQQYFYEPSSSTGTPVYEVIDPNDLPEDVRSKLESQYPDLRSLAVEVDSEEGISGNDGSSGSKEQALTWLQTGKLGFTAGTAAVAQVDVLRLAIGNQHPLDLDLTTTVMGEGFGEVSDEQLTFNSLIQPTGGLVNMIFSRNDLRLYPFKTNTESDWVAKLNTDDPAEKPTAIDFGMSGGLKLLGTREMEETRSDVIPTAYADVGLRLTTTAAQRDSDLEEPPVGTFTTQVRFFTTAILTGSETLGETFATESKTFFFGISADLVIQVADFVELRANYAQAFDQAGLSNTDLDRHVFTIAANYMVNR